MPRQITDPDSEESGDELYTDARPSLPTALTPHETSRRAGTVETLSSDEGQESKSDAEEADSANAEEIPGRKLPDRSAQPAEDDDAESDEAEQDDGEEESEFVVEAIMRHETVKGQVLYEVKWQGYGSSDNTWEPEAHLKGLDALTAYHKKIGGRPEPAAPPSSRGRSSKGDAKRGRATRGSDANGTAKRAKTSQQGRNRKANTESDEDEDAEWQYEAPSEWRPPAPLRDAWEDRISEIVDMDMDDNGVKWVMLRWVDEDEKGRKRATRAQATTVYIAAPQAMLRFYEAHLTFTKPKSRGGTPGTTPEPS